MILTFNGGHSLYATKHNSIICEFKNGPFKGSAANHHYVIENVVETLNGRDTITANALEGLKVVDIIERIYETRDLKKLKEKRNG